MLSSPLKDGRRVLGEKTTNAFSKSQNNKDIAATSPIKPTHSLSASTIFSSRSHAGQKRSIDQLDGVQGQSSSLNSEARSQRGEGFQIFGEDTSSITSPEKKIHSPTPTTNNSEASPREIDTTEPQPLAPTHNEKADKQPFASTSAVPIDPEARKLFIQEKAGLLRSRLQNAAKKSNNNQIDRRLSALEAHCRNRKLIPRPATSSTPISIIDTNITPKAKTPKLLPAPDLRPTPYSARHNTRPIPSSPPESTASANRVEETEDMSTPVQSQSYQQSMPSNAPTNPMQLSSPPGSTGTQGQATTNPSFLECRVVEKMIAASKDIDKGEAANGLVKLMETTEEYDNLDKWTG